MGKYFVFIAWIFLSACDGVELNNSDIKKNLLKKDNEIAASHKDVEESNFIDVFRQHFRNGEYQKMLEMTSQSSIDEVGERSVKKCYENLIFPIQMRYISSEAVEGFKASEYLKKHGINGNIIYLRHEVEDRGSVAVVKIPIIRTDDKLLLILMAGIDKSIVFSDSGCLIKWMFPKR